MTIRDQIMSKRRRGELIDNLCKKLSNTQKKLKNAQNETDTQSPTSYDEQENVASTTNPPVMNFVKSVRKWISCYAMTQAN